MNDPNAARSDRTPGDDQPGGEHPGGVPGHVTGQPAAGEPAAGDPGRGEGPGDGGRPGADGADDASASDEPGGPAGIDTPEDDDDPREQPVPPGSALAAVAQASSPPRPPRRTGVFLDPEDLRAHVGSLLRAILGGYEVDAFGNYTFTHEGARVFVTVNGSPIGPQVGVFSVTNLEVDLTPDLATFLLTTNHTLGFGAFSYDLGNRAVWLRHTLLGTTLDGPELQSAVAAVATTAARLDQPIRDRFGGRTFADAPDEVQKGVEPPHVDPEPGPPNASGYL